MTVRMPAPPNPLLTSLPFVDVRELRSTRSLLAFFTLAFVWTWTWGSLGFALKADLPIAATALSMLSGFGPSLAAVAVVACTTGRAGLRRWLTRCLQWRVGWRWVLLSFAFPAAAMSLAAAAQVALGGTLPPSPAAGHVGQSDGPFGWFALSVIASSVLFAWLFNRSQGSVVPVQVLVPVLVSATLPLMQFGRDAADSRSVVSLSGGHDPVLPRRP